MVAGGLTILVIAAAARIPFSSTTLRERVIATLTDRLDAEVPTRLSWRTWPSHVHARTQKALHETAKGPAGNPPGLFSGV